MRRARRRYSLSVLVVGGIALGIAAFLLLASYIGAQHRYDRFHGKYNEIVRVRHDQLLQGNAVSQSALTYSGLPVLIKDRLPQVEQFVRLGHWIANDVVFRREDKVYRGRDCLFADAAFFDVFSFRLLIGDPHRALQAPNSLVLTESLAQFLFDGADAMGQEVLFENKHRFVVTGIVEDPPLHSHIQYDMLASLSTMTSWGLEVYGDEQFRARYTYAYLQLQAGSDLEEVEASLNQEMTERLGASPVENRFFLQALGDIHLYSDLENEMSETGNGKSLWILIGIAALILLISWMNHLNILSAMLLDHQESRRMQRILGATKSMSFHAVFQSSFLYGMMGLVVGFLAALILQPFLVKIGAVQLMAIWSADSSSFIAPLVGALVLGTMLISFLLAAGFFQIDRLMAYRRRFGRGSLQWRRLLVGLQVGIIIVLLIGAGIVHAQMRFMQEKDLGLSVDHVFAIRAPLGTDYDALQQAYPGFASQASFIPGIELLTVSNRIPGDQLELIDEVVINGEALGVNLYRNYGDASFFDVYQIPIDISTKAFTSRSSERKIILNERAVEQLGFENASAAMNADVSFWENDPSRVVGIVKDHHQLSLHHEVLPIVYSLAPNDFLSDGYYSFRVDPRADLQEVFGGIQDAYTEAFPYTQFDLVDVQSSFEHQYRADAQFRLLTMVFAAIAVMVAGLGLLGLVTITAKRREKEVGIRKTLGATVASIFVLLSKEFVKITALSLLIAMPVAAWLGNRWLQNFAHHTDRVIWPFVLGAAAIFIITVLIIGRQCFRAATLNPAKTLRKP